MAEESTEVKSAGPSSPRSPQSSSVSGKPCSPHSPRQPPRRVKLTEQQLDSLTKDELATKWHEQDLYVECLEAQAAAQEGDLASLRESEDKYRQQYAEASHREKILVRRLASKEQELQEYINQIAEMKAAHAPSAAALRTALLDPAVNILIQKLRQELISTKAKLEDTQNELSAWKFTPDSNTGKRLMAKCRLLYQENEELGRMIASGRIAKLEGELALQKSFSEEVKKSQSELDEFLQDLDEDVEGMQSTIYFLQQELRKARESVTLLQQENAALKSNSNENNLTNGLSPHTPPIKKEEMEDNVARDGKPLIKSEDSDMCKGARTPPLSSQRSPSDSDATSAERTERVERKPSQTDHNDESSSDSAALIIKVENEELSDREEEQQQQQHQPQQQQQQQQHEESRSSKRTLRTKNHNRNSGKTNGEDVVTRTTRGRERTKREKSAPGSDDERTHKKKQRRESILSLDYNEADDDALVLTNVRRTLVSSTIKDAFARSKHTLPELPYDYKALEPIICAEIMQLHHSKHHATYVNNLNVAEEKMKEAVAKGDVGAQIALGPAIKFNGGGHLNHSIFWSNLSPHGGKPDAALVKQIERDFGSMEEMKKRLSESTVAIQGSGWGWLGYEPKSKSLRIATCANQDPLQPTTGLVPLFGIDVWEHAYYLQYKNVRPDYVKAIFDIVNWNDVNARYKNAAGC